ncbi:MAG TPA: DNA mismatch repair protein MutS, partial [Bacteroidales bacterium]|nr:DNA mismatch repair protein MutS [Bacteroidales bacterium]
TKTIVKRGVTELVTPGIAFSDKVLENKENNFLASLHLLEGESGVAFLDVSTGEFLLAQGENEYIDKLMQTFRPREVLVQKNKLRLFHDRFGGRYYTATFDDWVFTEDYARDLLLRHFATTSLKGFGVEELGRGIVAAGAALHYLADTQHDKVAHITRIARIDEERYVWLDRFTIRNLELIHSPHEGARTLFDVMDRTHSPMGARLLKRWILLPLRSGEAITRRQEAVGALLGDEDLAGTLGQTLQQVGDMERLISRVAVRKAGPREVVQLARSLRLAGQLREACLARENPELHRMGESLDPCLALCERIEGDLNDDPPATLAKGGVVRKGVDPSLDELRELAFSGKDRLAAIQREEAERTGISSLKIGYNNVFGYYLEVTNAHKDKVPEAWHRKQTLVGSERYITEELKEYETRILGAEEKILQLEDEIYGRLLDRVAEEIGPVQTNAATMARLDVLLSFALLAREQRYVRPALREDYVLDIRQGRHPVIECQLPVGEEYVANDLYLDDADQQVIIITGPNMSGKSALLRQTALIVLMAQMGSYVPAEQAGIGLVDKIFTRVGASDNISSGESTFMVEMNETASILNNISSRSLILLDEIGRGTSTYDGISIAWAITEYLHQHPLYRPKVLFATHYHELNELAATLPRVKNFNVAVKESGNRVLFIRKLVPGGSAHSFGIHVARMAGMPRSVIDRAEELLERLESSHSGENLGGRGPRTRAEARPAADQYQLSFIQLNDPLLEQIRDDILNTDIDTLTPVEALMKLNAIRKLLKKK